MRSLALLPATLLMCAPAFCQTPDAVIRSSVREVLLDVVVRDAHGHLITNLKPADITVYEDGVRQDVRSFRLVAGAEVRAEDEKQAAEAQALALASASTAPKAPRPPVNPLRTVNIVCLILNDLTAASPGASLANPTRPFAFEAARKFIDNQLRPNTFIGIFSLDSTGLRPVYPFSNDRERLLKAAELASLNQLPPIALGSAAVLNGLSTSVGVAGLGSRGNATDGLGSQHDMTFAAMAGLREIDALKGLIRQLAASPFHKTVLLLSGGLTRPPDQLEYWDSMVRAAVDGGITFYAVDAHGMDPYYDPTATSSAMLSYAASLSAQQGSTSQEGLQPKPGVIGNLGPPTLTTRTMELAHQDDYVRFAVSSANTQEALRELAERTGGFLIANTNNLDPLLAHVMEEVDTHYEIAYPPVSNREDGHFRKIEVKLARPGLRVETRGGYFALPDTGSPVTPEEMAGLRVLDTHPRPQAFDFLSHAYRFGEAGGNAQYAIAFEMPISNLTATPSETVHRQRLHASLLALVKNSQGQIVDRVSKDVPSELSDDRLADVRHDLMTYQHAVTLPPGRYTIESAIVDHEGNRASARVVEIDNREQAGVGISDLALVRKLENLSRPPDSADPFEFAGSRSAPTGKRVLPFVNTDLFVGSIPSVYFVVYPQRGSRAKPALRVRLLKDGRLLATRKLPLPEPNQSGRIPMWIEETRDPGSYPLSITATQGASSSERTLAYTAAAK